MTGQLYYHLVVTLPMYLVLCAGFYGILKKAGRTPWKAFVPVLNLLELTDMVGRPRRWMIWFFIPVINLIFGTSLALDIARSFGKQKFHSHLLAVVMPFFYFLWIGFNKKDNYVGKYHEFFRTKEEDRERGWEKKWNMPTGKGKVGREVRDWADAILFAGTAAIIIRTFLIEAFMIPTTSMEGTLRAGDFLFVSKFHYGVRLPMVPLSIPFVHNTFPFSSTTKSYLPWIQLPYARTWGFSDVQRNDIVVFNYPDDDINADVPQLGPIPETSMKQNYIKRCVAIPGDLLQIKNQKLYINNEPAWEAEELQTSFIANDPKGMLTAEVLAELGFRADQNDKNSNALFPGSDFFSPVPYSVLITHKSGFTRPVALNMSKAKYEELKAKNLPGLTIKQDSSLVTGYIPFNQYLRNCLNDSANMLSYNQPPTKNWIFPKAPRQYQWALDEFGPLWIPKAGEKVALNDSTYPLYQKVIRVYEGHTLERTGKNQYSVDGQAVKEYTFEKNYYFMMGDNRHQSADSRYWGFVPEDHIIGRPLLVLANIYERSRFFKSMSGLEP